MSATVTRPVTLTDAMLVSSTALENDFPEWAAATSYVVGNRVMRSAAGVHKNFENLIAGINSTLPELATTGATPRWLDLGHTNRWAMFDGKVGTITTRASSLSVVVKPGSIGSVALLGLVGKNAVVTAKDQTGGVEIYNRSVNLDNTSILSFYEWFFSDFVQRADVVLNDLPTQYNSMEVTVTLTTDAGNVSIGAGLFGKVSSIGVSKYGSGVGIISFAKKVPDAFGNITVFRPTNPNSNRMNLQLMVPKEQFTQVFNTLKSLDAILCIYSGVADDGFEPFIALGFYKDFYITVEYISHYAMTLEIEGVN